MAGAICAAEKASAAFYTVSDHTAAAMLTNRGELMDCAFEAVKHVTIPRCDDLEAQLIIIAAYFADCHVSETGFDRVDHAITVI